MITRLRIEAENIDKEHLSAELASQTYEIIRMVDPRGHKFRWECTDDVTSFDRQNKVYKGRRVLVRKETL